ncbi:serine hydrolase domain-containing protein [Variovorax saccharolyticus]|uniref:serine hydrolase domain-containing protein n=1 Tax=Variovorax saccharolyticus TaxID=3053516 RepID=UPI0025768C77|nr:serine hydrolase [Variovorax sp. J31P216]MDM0027368.1 serine hydrolase [Variovorax sp. J31P216]
MRRNLEAFPRWRHPRPRRHDAGQQRCVTLMSMRLPGVAALVLTVVLGACGGGGGGGGGGVAVGVGNGAGATSAAPACDADSITSQLPAASALNARAKCLELNTPYVPPPGNVLEHHASGFAKTLCSAVFITGLDPAVAAESLGYFVAPYAQRKLMAAPVVDRSKNEVRVAIPNGPTLVARHFGSQGCITLPPGKDEVFFTPVQVKSALADPSTMPWPMGDVLPSDPLPAAIDAAKLTQAVDAAFGNPEAYTSAFVVTHKGRIVGERYQAGVGVATPLESWSMGKSVTATMIGVLIKQGVYQLDQPAPIPEWQGEGDARKQIRISDIMRMSSGLRIKAPDDPDFDPDGTYPDHLYYYTGRINAFNYASTRPQQWPPNAVGRYRNTDPVLANYLVRLAVEKRGEEYLSFPQRNVFDKIGIRSMVIEADPYGNLLTQGYDFMSARDWARLGNLYLQDGVWNGERILPEGFVSFVSTVAPAWAADKRPIYGGFFWINGTGALAVPTSAYYMLGAAGQFVVVVPSHDLVVVRIGYSKGERFATTTLNQALALLTSAVPRAR